MLFRSRGEAPPGEVHGGGSHSSSTSAFPEQSEQRALCITFKLVMRMFIEVGVWLTTVLHERTEKKQRKTHV